MLQSIETKYIGPTDYYGARIKATASSGLSVTTHYDYSMSERECHFQAVKVLCDKLGWIGTVVCGSSKQGMVWVFTDGQPEFTIESKD